MIWVGSQVLPHEGDVRAWLRRTLDPADLEDVIQESYCRLSGLQSVEHIRSGRAYLFTTARSIVLERIRRSRVVSIEAAADLETWRIVEESPSPERVAAGRHELARVCALIEALPARCRRILKLRKMEGLPQREVAQALGVPEHTVENEVARGLRLILKAIAEGEQAAERALSNMEKDERVRDSRSDR